MAVLSVVLFHLRGSFLPGGFAGVDVFFVISGYVVSASLAHRRDSSFGAYLLDFYARRIVRIFPALLVCLLLTGVLTTLLVPASWLSQTTSFTGIAAVVGLSNVALVWLSDGYFSPRSEFNPFTHTWSLAVEEQFYLVFPLLLYVWLRHRDTGSSWRAALGRLALPALLIASLVYCALVTSPRPDLAYYMLPSRFWELASGAMLLRLHQSGRALPADNRQAGLWTVAGAILIGLTFGFAQARAFPFPWAIPAVVGAMLMIAGAVGDVSGRSMPGALMASRGMTYIGKLSYSLYLWHWPVIVLLRWTTGVHSAWTLALAASLSLVLAMLSYHLVERGRWWRQRLEGWQPQRTAAIGAAGVLACTVGMAAVLKSQERISLSVTRDRQTWYPEAWPASTAPLPVARNALAGRKVFVWGDSHVGAYSTMLQALREQTGAEVFTYSRGGCPVASLRGPAAAYCRDQTDQTIADIKNKAAAGDLVFLASLRVPRLADQWETFEAGADAPAIAATRSARQAESEREAHAIVAALEQAGLRVVIDAPKPIFKSPPFRCSDDFNANNPICDAGFQLDRGFLESHRRPTMDALARLQGLHPNLVVWDPFPVLCPGSTCSAFDGSKPLFFDGDHLSAHGNRKLYPAFVDVLVAGGRTSAPKAP